MKLTALLTYSGSDCSALFSSAQFTTEVVEHGDGLSKMTSFQIFAISVGRDQVTSAINYARFQGGIFEDVVTEDLNGDVLQRTSRSIPSIENVIQDLNIGLSLLGQ
ncbi:hypothetical protein KCU90_g64, partial [Aureobasidium melanogenum]